MLLALPLPASAEAEFACATATQLVGAPSIPAFPAFLRTLRPVHAERWKRLLLHARLSGAEPRHTPQGCRHPCVSAASRLAQPFCTRPPDFRERTRWASYCRVFVLLFRSAPFRHRQSRGDASMAASAKTRSQQTGSFGGLCVRALEGCFWFLLPFRICLSRTYLSPLTHISEEAR